MGISDLRNAFIAELPAGWRVTDCELHTVPNSGNQQQIVVNGFDAAGKPFAQDSGPFVPGENLAAKIRDMAKGLLNSETNPTQPPVVAATNQAHVQAPVQPISTGKAVTGTPNLNGLQGAFANFTQRVEAAAGKLAQRMQQVGDYTETAVGKFSGGVDKIEATAKQIDDAANQLTNGGPSGPLPNGT